MVGRSARAGVCVSGYTHTWSYNNDRQGPLAAVVVVASTSAKVLSGVVAVVCASKKSVPLDPSIPFHYLPNRCISKQSSAPWMIYRGKISHTNEERTVKRRRRPSWSSSSSSVCWCNCLHTIPPKRREGEVQKGTGGRSHHVDATDGAALLVHQGGHHHPGYGSGNDQVSHVNESPLIAHQKLAPKTGEDRWLRRAGGDFLIDYASKTVRHRQQKCWFCGVFFWCVTFPSHCARKVRRASLHFNSGSRKTPKLAWENGRKRREGKGDVHDSKPRQWVQCF